MQSKPTPSKPGGRGRGGRETGTTTRPVPCCAVLTTHPPGPKRKRLLYANQPPIPQSSPLLRRVALNDCFTKIIKSRQKNDRHPYPDRQTWTNFVNLPRRTRHPPTSQATTSSTRYWGGRGGARRESLLAVCCITSIEIPVKKHSYKPARQTCRLTNKTILPFAFRRVDPTICFSLPDMTR